MSGLTEEEMDKVRAEIDELIEDLLEVIDGRNQGITLSAFGHIIGISASHWLDLVKRCSAVTEMAAITYHENNPQTEH